MDKHRLLTLTVLRQKVGMTQMELALAVEVSQTTISHWEQEQAIPSMKAHSVLAVLRAKDRSAIPAGIGSGDLSRPWDDVLLDLAGAKTGKESQRPRLKASAGQVAARARA